MKNIFSVFSFFFFFFFFFVIFCISFHHPGAISSVKTRLVDTMKLLKSSFKWLFGMSGKGSRGHSTSFTVGNIADSSGA